MNRMSFEGVPNKTKSPVAELYQQQEAVTRSTEDIVQEAMALGVQFGSNEASREIPESELKEMVQRAGTLIDELSQIINEFSDGELREMAYETRHVLEEYVGKKAEPLQ